MKDSLENLDRCDEEVSVMRASLKRIIDENPENCLSVFELPTGFGKTYNIRKYIADCLKDSSNTTRFFYITPKRKNVEDFLEKLKNDDFRDNPQFFDEHVIHVKNYVDNIVFHAEIFKEISGDFGRLDSFRKLKKTLDTYLSLPEEAKNSLLDEQIRNDERAFRKDLSNKLDQLIHLKGYKEKIGEIRGKYPWLLKLYPMMEAPKYRVFAMTADKFYFGYDPIIDRSGKFLTSELTKNAVIFFDESDDVKQSLLKQQIQQTIDYRLDLPLLVKDIYNGCVNCKINSNLLLQKETKDQNKTTAESLKKLQAMITDVFQRHNLQYTFKLEEKEEKENVFLWKDYTTVTMVNGKETKNKLYIHTDEEKKVNIITDKEEGSEDSDHSFVKLISDLYNAFRYFITFILMAGENYVAYQNSFVIPKTKEKRKDILSLDDGISTALSSFSLGESTVQNLKRIILSQYKETKSRKRSSSLTYDYYQDGFQFYTFLDSISHDLDTKILMLYLNDTPERFVLTLAQRARVFLLSATAETKSVIGNFNLDYFEDQLAAPLCRPTKEEKEKMKEEYSRRRQQKRDSIFVEKMEAGEDNDLTSVFKDNPAFKQLMDDKINPYSNLEPFFKKRFIKVTCAIRKFLTNPLSRVLVCMTNKLLRKNNWDLFNQENILDVVNGIMKLDKIDKSHDPKIVCMDSSDFENQKSEYLNQTKNGNRVIIFTTYPTAGTGQNLQYEDENGEEKDFDSIYLEYPTNIVKKIDKNSGQADLLLSISQVMSLRQDGEIDNSRCRKLISQRIRNSTGNYRNKQESPAGNKDDIYLVNSVNAESVAILKQAIGRMNRTSHQNREERIYIDSDIFDKVNFSQEVPGFQTPEFNRLLESMKTEKPLGSIDVQNLNLGQSRSDYARKRIRSRLSESRTEWTDVNMEFWKEFRRFVLRHPTISEEELNQPENADFKDFYMHSSGKSKINSYYYHLSEDVDYQGEQWIDRISYYATKKCPIPLSEKSFHLPELMKITYLKNFFEMKENQFATSFAPNDYILVPSVFHDIYKGALGEQVGDRLLHQLNLELEEISDKTKFEKFDFQVKDHPDIYIDFKMWEESFEVPGEPMIEKFHRHLEAIGGKKAFIINICENEGRKPQRYCGGSIITIPGILTKTRDKKGLTFDKDICRTLVEEIKNENADK